MLHTVNKSPFEKASLESCLAHAREGSAVLLLEDAVYAALEGTGMEDLVRGAAANCRLYALGPDLDARGLARDRVIDAISVIDYGGFVDLVVAHDNVQAWL